VTSAHGHDDPRRDRYRDLGLAFVVVVEVDADVLVDDGEVDDGEVDDVLDVVVVGLLISVSAWVSAFCATVSASTPAFSF
jgi:hypothetical protein